MKRYFQFSHIFYTVYKMNENRLEFFSE
jgi:hypothetical protein